MLKNLLNWLKSLLQKKKTVSEPTLTANELEILLLNSKIIELKESEMNNLVYIEELEAELDILEEALVSHDKHSTLDAYKEWMDSNVSPKSVYYNFGSGRKRVHTIFEESLKDETEIRAFIKDDMNFDGTMFDTADKLVYQFNVKMSNKYPTQNWYAYDDDLYGTAEYWATAKQTIQAIHDNGKYGDCDDMMTLKYSCLYYLLKDLFPNDMWRLRGFIVDVWSGGGHALLGWIKEGPNDWVPIETTFRDADQTFMWNKNYAIGSQLFYQIRYSFDNVNEYVKLE